MNTAIHRLVDRCRAGEHAAAVARLASGWVILGERQVLAGTSMRSRRRRASVFYPTWPGSAMR